MTLRERLLVWLVRQLLPCPTVVARIAPTSEQRIMIVNINFPMSDIHYERFKERFQPLIDRKLVAHVLILEQGVSVAVL